MILCLPILTRRSETLFALLYYFVPDAHQLAATQRVAAILVLAGILISIKARR